MKKSQKISFVASGIALLLGIALIITSVFADFRTLSNKINGGGSGDSSFEEEVQSGDELQEDSVQTEGNANQTLLVSQMVNDDDDLKKGGTAIGTVYYVDAVNGNDANDGLSEKRPFQTLRRVNSLVLEPGDRVLFKRDCVWNGTLYPQGGGSKNAPIIIGMYGDGNAKPMINGRGEVRATVQLRDISYITVRNLEITNYCKEVSEDREGIYVLAREGEVYGVTLQNNYIHDVTTRLTSRNSGGILFGHRVSGLKYRQVMFHDVLIENNRIENLMNIGIFCNNAENTVIRNNIVNNAKGDGIVLSNSTTGLIEYNIVYTCGDNEVDAAYANIWAINSTDVTHQYNESYDSLNYRDGQGFDIDMNSINTTIQYNYSHDNLGGFLLTCDYYYEHYGSVVRYNISENDAEELIRISGPDGDAILTPDKVKYQIYNNTFYTTAQLNEAIAMQDYQSTDGFLGYIHNNIFYIDGYTADFGVNASMGAFEYSNNCYFGFDELDIMMLNDTNPIMENPLLYAPGTAGIGRDSATVYQLLEGSPCLNAGILKKDNGGKDYFGNKVSSTEAPHIGAYNGAGVSRPENFNYLAGRIATASGYYNLQVFDHKPSYMVGLTDERVSTTVSTDALTENQEAWFEFDLHEAVTLQSVVLTAAKDTTYFPQRYRIEVWKNNEWVTVSTGSMQDKPKSYDTIIHNFEQVTTDKIRIVADTLNSYDGIYRMEIAEIAAFSIEKTIQ